MFPILHFICHAVALNYSYYSPSGIFFLGSIFVCPCKLETDHSIGVDEMISFGL